LGRSVVIDFDNRGVVHRDAKSLRALGNSNIKEVFRVIKQDILRRSQVDIVLDQK